MEEAFCDKTSFSNHCDSKGYAHFTPFQRIQGCGISKLCNTSLAMRNKVQRPSPSQLRLASSISASLSTQTPPTHAHMKEAMNPQAKHLEHQRSTLGLFVTTVESLVSLSSPSGTPKSSRVTYPSSKCLHRFNASCAFVLQAVHSNLNTTFLVVFAFLWNTGFV